ncbi:MAG: hypothetical protein QOJ39_1245 [Candidatus Eremiobacteraeota bacterium]|jgi:hypothetical protein|nr:hypothetical protein [Candidatus Eremiobacteraeota bacterium]
MGDHINRPEGPAPLLAAGSKAVHLDTPIGPRPQLNGPPIEGTAEAGLAGVTGVSFSKSLAAIKGMNSDGGVGVLAEGDVALHATGRLAGLFQGDVEVTGDIRLTNADCAEEFDVVDGPSIEPGTVMVLTDDGLVSPSRAAYDTRVAGVVSGAGDYRPALTLDAHSSARERLPLALMGKVFCRVDATPASIQVGDLLTTSPIEGCAMKAVDPARAFGTVIGKALRPLESGLGLIPILVGLG